MQHPTAGKTISQKVIWHLKVLAGAVIIAMIFSLVLQQKLIHREFPMMLTMTLLQLEIFIWLGYWFFESIQFDSPNFKRQIIIRLLLFYLAVLLVAFFLFITIFFTTSYLQGESLAATGRQFREVEMNGFIAATLIGFALGALFFFYTQWDDALKREQKQREEKLVYQYENLKKQLNPHFLFNSLNTLSSLVGTSPEISEEFVMKLSSIYRYVIDSEEKKLVALQEELQFVKDYFYLQKIRDEDKIHLKIEIKEIENKQVLPVSLQLLIENALKHNAATRNRPLLITLHEEGMDIVVVRNDLQKKTQLNDSPRKGLKNLNERCKLIMNREIEMYETTDEFVVKIPVFINS